MQKKDHGNTNLKKNVYSGRSQEDKCNNNPLVAFFFFDIFRFQDLFCKYVITLKVEYTFPQIGCHAWAIKGRITFGYVYRT